MSLSSSWQWLDQRTAKPAASIGRQLRQLIHAAGEAPCLYHSVVLSEHGQTPAPLFDATYGKRLDSVVRDLVDADRTVMFSGGTSEGTGYLGALFNRLVVGCGRTARGVRRLLRADDGDQFVELPRQRPLREHAV